MIKIINYIMLGIASASIIVMLGIHFLQWPLGLNFMFSNFFAAYIFLYGFKNIARNKNKSLNYFFMFFAVIMIIMNIIGIGYK